MFHWAQRLIEINAALSGVAAWQTLFHEYVHAGLSDGGMDTNLTAGTAEVVADIVASLFTGLLLSRTFQPSVKPKRTARRRP